MIYSYIKKDSQTIQPTVIRPDKKRRWLAGGILAVGLFLLGNAVFPIIYYQVYLSPRFTLKEGESIAFAQEAKYNQPMIANTFDLVDYTKLSNWISGVDQPTVTEETAAYTLSIPKLGVQSAVVKVGGDDLADSLIQYPGTSLPGKSGNPVIFGHSTLPQFSKPNKYKSIFTYLPKLQEGDAVWVDIDGVSYKYLVERLVEMGPHDLSILAQRYDDSYLTLVTCVPPGTYLKRLVVRARITKAD